MLVSCFQRMRSKNAIFSKGMRRKEAVRLDGKERCGFLANQVDFCAKAKKILEGVKNRQSGLLLMCVSQR